jgi:hypothetical protein
VKEAGTSARAFTHESNKREAIALRMSRNLTLQPDEEEPGEIEVHL